MNSGLGARAASRPQPWSDRIRGLLPSGQTLPDREFERRHRLLLTLLWVQVPILSAYSLSRGYGISHLVIHALPIVAFAAAGSLPLSNRRLRASAVALGLLTASAVAVHTSGGLIEAHFYFFVVVVLLTLYEDWLPFLLALAYVVIHHGVGGVIDREAVYVHGGDPWLWAGVHGAFITLAGASAVLAWRLNEDVRDREQAAKRAMQRSERRYRTLAENATVGICETNLEGIATYVNERWCELTGLSAEQWRGERWFRSLHPDDREEMQRVSSDALSEPFTLRFRFLRPDGSSVWVSGRSSPVHDANGKLSSYLGTVADITDLMLAEERLTELAHTDELTGLANRRRFAEELKVAVAHSGRQEQMGALLALDLDGFKEVNDTLGHAAGDQLLRETASALDERLRDGDLIGRLGGDEFAVFLPGCDAPSAERVATQLIEALRDRRETAPGRRGITTSIGIALVDGAVGADELLIRGDIALYTAKDLGGDVLAFYDRHRDERHRDSDSDSDSSRDTFAITRSRRQAIGGGEPGLSAQPG